ncbi:MAG: Ig-like domain-containing protein, partial [Novosphingobium sp.]
ANIDSVTVKVCLTATKNVTANDTDPDGDLPLTVTAVQTSTLADVSIADPNTISVTGYGSPGSQAVTYTIKDSRGATATGQLNITVQSGTGCN